MDLSKIKPLADDVAAKKVALLEAADDSRRAKERDDAFGEPDKARHVHLRDCALALEAAVEILHYEVTKEIDALYGLVDLHKVEGT